MAQPPRDVALFVRFLSLGMELLYLLCRSVGLSVPKIFQHIFVNKYLFHLGDDEKEEED